MSADIVKQAPASMVEHDTKTILDALSRAAADPQVDVAKLERLLAMQREILADQRQAAYKDALARLQASMPQIDKRGIITDRDGAMRNRYAKLEDIDKAIRPVCTAEGFSFTFDSHPTPDGKATTYTCDMHHRDGHTERKSITMPIDSGPGRTPVQAVGSTTSYARRYLISMHLNLITRDQDTDGVDVTPLTTEQVMEIKASLTEARGDETRFLKWLGVASFEEIPASEFKRAMSFIAEKKRQSR